MGGERRILRCPDIFFGGNWSSFGFGSGIGQNPTWKSAGKTARDARTGSRASCRNGRGCVARRARRDIIPFRLRLMKILFECRGWSGSGGFASVFREGLAW